MLWYFYERYKIDTWWKHGLYMDIRVGLFIISMDHKNVV